MKALCDGKGPEKSQQDDSQQRLSEQITVNTVCLTPYSHLLSVGFCFLFFLYLLRFLPPYLPPHQHHHHSHRTVIKVGETRYVRRAFVFTWLLRQPPKLWATLNEIPACHQSLGSTKRRLLRSRRGRLGVRRGWGGGGEGEGVHMAGVEAEWPRLLRTLN